MTTTSKPNAVQTRNAQFDDIDAKLEQLRQLRQDLSRRTKGLGPKNWAFTGRGGDLERLQDALADALAPWTETIEANRDAEAGRYDAALTAALTPETTR